MTIYRIFTGFMLAGALLLAACGESQIEVPSASQRPVEVTEVSVDMTEVALTEGESVTLIANVSPDDATDKTVSWSSDNTAVATVNESGKVAAVAAGEATITAKAGEKSGTCKVKVNAEPAPQPQPQPEPPVGVGAAGLSSMSEKRGH